MGFFRQEYWSGLPFPPPGIFPTQGLNGHLLCLLRCRRILYPLSQEGCPCVVYWAQFNLSLIHKGLNLSIRYCTMVCMKLDVGWFQSYWLSDIPGAAFSWPIHSSHPDVSQGLISLFSSTLDHLPPHLLSTLTGLGFYNYLVVFLTIFNAFQNFTQT